MDNVMNAALDGRSGLAVFGDGQRDEPLLGSTARSDSNWRQTMKVRQIARIYGNEQQADNGDGKKQQKMTMKMSDGKAYWQCMMTMYNERQTTAKNDNNVNEGWRRIMAAHGGNKRRRHTKVANKGDDQCHMLKFK
eukprot:CAMPEP_0172478028 /NCGR_PEP_ID=MMETSP1066-20121228/1724_1 /TAXON_ID=671091 /ORGANISM="Coscinodiscus wailesii, Strain CCMP2513" /LENGTH=135 /DNA_ID=CAMNT_0013237215 /DNA_START=185 /DNA_END=593 /DNA_ORIENTATION=-